MGLAAASEPGSSADGETADALRTWTSLKGARVEASLVSVSGGRVTLKKRDGKLVSIHKTRLSKQDQQFLEQRAAEQTLPKKRLDTRTRSRVDMSAAFKEKGYRHWGPFKRTPIVYDYVAGLYRGGRKYFYLACVKSAGRETAVLERSIQGQKQGSAKWLFTSKLINDVFLPKEPKKKAPFVQMARTCMIEDKQAGLVCLNSVFPGKYGSSPLSPALFSSKSGAPGTWTYHGKLKFDPPPPKVRHHCEGAIVRGPNGNWRVYLAGYGVTVAMAESASLGGPWPFRSRGSRSLVDVAEPLQKVFGKKEGGCFPYVLKVSDNEYHLWISEGWPCKAVWHLSSENGVDFQFYGSQPEILPTAVPGLSAMKGVRAFLGPEGKTIHAYIPFHVKGKGWVIHESTMSVGQDPSFPQR